MATTLEPLGWSLGEGPGPHDVTPGTQPLGGPQNDQSRENSQTTGYKPMLEEHSGTVAQSGATDYQHMLDDGT